jgi:hypothetical protein
MLNSKTRFGKLQTAILIVIALVMGANLISPAVAHVTRRLGHLYRHLDPRYVNVGEAATSAANADKLDNIDSAAFQQKCQDGAVLAYAFINGNGGDGGTGGTPSTTGFSTSGVGPSFNCKGGAIEVQHFPAGFYTVRIPGITNAPNATQGIFIFQSADDHNDGSVTIDTHSSDDYIEVDTWNVADGTSDDADFYLVALK